MNQLRRRHHSGWVSVVGPTEDGERFKAWAESATGERSAPGDELRFFSVDSAKDWADGLAKALGGRHDCESEGCEPWESFTG